ncbi:hypothetical protein ACN47E_006175 [Coniothyrium glycines]
MSLDQHIYGSTDWHLPSPSSTPTSGTFPDATLKTPRTDVFPHSHFLDAWATPQVNGQHTPVQTPSFTLSTPVDRPSSSYSPALRTPEDPEFHVNHFAPQNLPLPPVEVSRRLSSSPDPGSIQKITKGSLSGQPAQQRSASMDFSHMQTPPPTRDSMSRRGLQQSAGQGFATPATVIQRTPTQATTHDAFLDQTPFGFGNAQFTPDMTQFPMVAPMSAPPMPHSRLFWDPQNDSAQMDLDMPMDDPFCPPSHKVEQNFEWQTFSTPAPIPMQPQALQPSFHGVQSPGPVGTFHMNTIGGAQFSRPGSFVSTSASVDPSMLFGFSSQEMNMSFGNVQPQRSQSVSSRQPYETQVRDSQREKQAVKKARSQHSRSNTNSSSGSVENIRPTLQRSNTDSGFRKSRPNSIEARVVIPAAASTIPRRPSPLKRQSGASLTAIPEIRRPRTRLIVDETGRARTETVSVEDDEETPRDTRKTSQVDLRRQYPGLWEEDDTESEGDEPALVMTLSRNASFNIPQPHRHSSKHARSDSDGLARSDSFKIPRPSARTSFGASDKASFETVRPVRRPAENLSRRISMEVPTHFDHLKETGDHSMPDSPGDALGALKKVVAGRQQRVDRASQNTLKAHNQRWAQASADLNATPHSHGHYDPFSNSFNGSPNTDGLTTPSTDLSSLSSESTRCICNGTDDSHPMIQCESCNKWLHMGCVGLHNTNLPPVYVCIFCTGQTPVARGGRVRGPIPFDSPLTHKSVFRR